MGDSKLIFSNSLLGIMAQCNVFKFSNVNFKGKNLKADFYVYF